MSDDGDTQDMAGETSQKKDSISEVELRHVNSLLVALFHEISQKDKDDEFEEETQAMSKLTVVLKRSQMKDNSEIVIKNVNTKKNMLKFLKCLYENTDGLEFLAELMYYLKDTPLLKMTYDMVTSHSLFFPTMMEPRSVMKDALIHLLHTFVDIDPTLCDVQQVPILLAAYGATMSATDQNILHILQIHEANNGSISEFKPYMFGEKSVEFYAQRKTADLMKMPKMEAVVDLLDKDKLWQSAFQFPLRRKLAFDAVQTDVDNRDLYDPCFVLPLIAHLVGPECVVNHSKFVHHGCLSYTFSALSGHDPALRAVAYYILNNFYQQLQAAQFLEKEQILYLLELVHSSVGKRNGKLASIITVFLVKATRVLIHQDDVMYSAVNAFLLVKPQLDTLNIPEFYKLFNSSADEYKQERSWMLQLLLAGLRELADFRIFEKRYTFKLLLTYYNSRLSDHFTRVLVLRIILKACGIKTASSILVKTYGLLPWLTGVLASNDLSSTQLSVLVDILVTVWQQQLEARERSSSDAPCLPIAFTNQILLALVTMLSCREISDVVMIEKFSSCLSSVLDHVQKTKKFHGNSGIEITTVSLSAFDTVVLIQQWLRIRQSMTSENQQSSASGRHVLNIATVKPFKPLLVFNKPKKIDDGGKEVQGDNQQVEGETDKNKVNESASEDVGNDGEKEVDNTNEHDDNSVDNNEVLIKKCVSYIINVVSHTRMQDLQIEDLHNILSWCLEETLRVNNENADPSMVNILCQCAQHSDGFCRLVLENKEAAQKLFSNLIALCKKTKNVDKVKSEIINLVKLLVQFSEKTYQSMKMDNLMPFLDVFSISLENMGFKKNHTPPRKTKNKNQTPQTDKSLKSSNKKIRKSNLVDAGSAKKIKVK